MKDSLKIFLLRSWVIGVVVVVGHFMMKLQHLSIGLILGVINTFLVDLVVLTILKGNQTHFPKGWKLFLRTILNIVTAIGLSLIIRLIDLALLNKGLITMPIETFRFIAYYQVMYYFGFFVYKKILVIIERKKYESNTNKPS
ncbi:MAG: hypothetical protein AB7T03_00130 [Bacilli bacterium]